MSRGLTPQRLKQSRRTEVRSGTTFHTHGLDLEAAQDYLATDPGRVYKRQVLRVWKVAHPGKAPNDKDLEALNDRALDQLRSFTKPPRTETIKPGDTLVKIVPVGSGPTKYTPFWTTKADLDAAVASGKNLSEYFALPIKSEAGRYRVYEMSAKAETQVFVGRVAPSSELGGTVTKEGGALQVLVPDRGAFNQPVRTMAVHNAPDLKAKRGYAAAQI